MKSEKKSNDLSCIPNGIVKEEPCTDSCKMQSKKVGGACKNGDVKEEDVKPCLRECNVVSKNSEDTTNKSNKNGASNQQASNSVKIEPNASFPPCSLSNDCGGAASSKSADNNLAGKCGRNGPSGVESQFMQQQSQIFVFSTVLANKGAEAVMRGQFSSIVDYHCAQPGTRKFLEKHPNNGNKGGQSPAEWLSSFNIGQKDPQPPELPVIEPDPPPFWDEQSNPRNSNGDKSVCNNESSVDDTINKVVNSQPSPHSLGETNCSSPGSLQPSLQGVKVPDENLTPQQRQHREEQLATIRKMQILFFPERKETAEGSMPPARAGNQAQNFGTDGVNSPAISPLDRFSPGEDWDKFPSQLIESKNKTSDNYSTATSSAGNVTPGPRSQGPPPPYYQSTRPASVPAALQTSNPSSPNNPTSTLSLPSPRASSALNSPADYGRQFLHGGGPRPGYNPAAGSPLTQESLSSGIGMENHLNQTSNPGTPVSHSHLVAFSPGESSATGPKDSIDFSSSQSPNVDEIFCQSLQNVNQEQNREQGGSAMGSKEANLMPVPSPQQIQYLNTFEGQELTIQKQPNTSLKDNNSPSNASGTIATSTIRMMSENGTSPLTENTGPSQSPLTPRTPSANPPFDSLGNKVVTSGQNSPATSYGQNMTEGMKPSEASHSPNKKQHHNESKISIQSNPEFSRGRHPINVRSQPDNVPLNPNNVNSCMGVQGAITANHFDPITSLAQMSQQLSSIAPKSLQGEGPIMHSMHEMNPSGIDYGDVGGFGPGMGCMTTTYSPIPRTGSMGIPSRSPMGYGLMHHSVYHGEPRGLQRPMDPHNLMRANVQVKPGAPNTIQYLPAGKPNPCPGGPRGPPSLDFLQGFANPSNQRCFPSNMGGPHPGNVHNMPQNVVFNGMIRPQRPNGFQNGMGPGHPMNQMRQPGPNAMRMQHMVGGAVFHSNRMSLDKPMMFGGEIMSQIPNHQPPNHNPRMYAPGNNQGNVMGMRSRAPNAPVQLGMHPNVDNNFKNGPFIRLPASESDYAQQYHNFQQQLYATGTRGIGPLHNNHHVGPNAPSFRPER